MLRDPDAFALVIAGLFDQLAGPLDEAQRARDVDAAIDTALAGYRVHPVPYLSIMGIDPGDAYPAWIAARIPGALTEVWADHGHDPHLVDPDRFVARVRQFWAA